MTEWRNRVLVGDVREQLALLPDESVHCVVTSPPYWGLRDYGAEGQLGMEATPEEFVSNMVAVFREVRRVLRGDGTLWLNLGDSYAGSGRGMNKDGSPNGGPKQATNAGSNLDFHDRLVGSGAIGRFWVAPPEGLKQKDLVGIPWRVAFALQADGWYLRADIVWSKPNPMPESVRDRPTKSHEYLFLLAKSERYYYDFAAVREPLAESSIARIQQPRFASQTGGAKDYGPDSNRSMRKTLENFATSHGVAAATPDYFNFRRDTKEGEVPGQSNAQHRLGRADSPMPTGRNKRTVWEIPTQPYAEAHFATYPEALVKPCILAGCPEGGIVLDPFMGSGTTGVVAKRAGRLYVGIELNPVYAAMAEQRIGSQGALL